MRLITVTHNHYALLPHFFRHYSQLGVSEFLIGAYFPQECKERIKEVDGGYRHRVFPIDGTYDGGKDTRWRHEIAADLLREDEWWVIADVDEFHEYPMPLPQLVDDLECQGARFFQSYMLDRITADGTSPELRDDEALWDQFPAAAYLSSVVMQGNGLKVMLVRGHARTNTGHHHAKKGAFFRAGFGGTVHHFKWFGDIAGKMQAKRHRIIKHRRGNRERLERFLAYWNCVKRLPVEGEFGFHYPVKPNDWPE